MKQKGFSTLEIIIAMLISMPCIFALGKAVHQSARTLRDYKNLEREIYGTVRMRQLLSEMMNEINLHSFSLLPRIHKGGNIRSTDGQANPVLKGTAAMRPIADSDAITYLRLNISQTLEVLSLSAQSSSVYVCTRYSGTFNSAMYKSYLLLSPAGFHESSGKISNVTLANGKYCCDIRLKPVHSMIGQNLLNLDLNLTRFIIPIERIYTIYIDRKGNLRHLGHTGLSNIENQPILERSSEIKIAQQALSNGLTQLTLRTKIRNREIKVMLTNNLPRKHFLDFLLNRP